MCASPKVYTTGDTDGVHELEGDPDIYVEDPEEVGHPPSNRLLALLILIPLAVIGRTAQRILDGYRWVERQIGRIR